MPIAVEWNASYIRGTFLVRLFPVSSPPRRSNHDNRAWSQPTRDISHCHDHTKESMWGTRSMWFGNNWPTLPGQRTSGISPQKFPWLCTQGLAGGKLSEAVVWLLPRCPSLGSYLFLFLLLFFLEACRFTRSNYARSLINMFVLRTCYGVFEYQIWVTIPWQTSCGVNAINAKMPRAGQ